MSRILIIDNNPDTQKALSGLLKYRTQHVFIVACSCQEGVQLALSQHPDLILINALLFMHNTYAFPRLMQQHKKTASISFLVYSSAQLGEVTHRQIEASGVAGVVELPISADELDAEIKKAITRHRPPQKKRCATGFMAKNRQTKCPKTFRSKKQTSQIGAVARG